jgi:hypothetical protein
MRRELIDNLQSSIQHNKKTAKNPLAFLSKQEESENN